jgi:hypothetical protein
MTVAAARKSLYLPIIALLLAPIAWAAGGDMRWLMVSALALIVPGVVARALLKDLLASRAGLLRRNHERALAAARRFLRTLSARPWIRHAIWLQYGVYTLDVGAMAHNNAGAALIELGRLDEAERDLMAAQRRDPHYPIPVFNRAVIAKLRGAETESVELAREAAALGYARGSVDLA